MRRRTLFSLSALALLACVGAGLSTLGAAEAAAAASAHSTASARSVASSAQSPILASPVTSATQGVDDFRFASLNAEYVLGRDSDNRSTLAVTETLVAVFPEIDQNRGIRRAIPLNYDGHPTDLRIESVSDENGTPRSFETEDDEDGDFLLVTIAADDYVHGEQSYVIEYTQHNVTFEPDDSDNQEFFWDVNGTGWAQPFDMVAMTLRMDAALGAAFTGDAACYRGAEGSTQICEGLMIQESMPPIVSASAANLGAYENLSIAVGFEPGTFVARDSSLAASPAGVIGATTGILSVGGLLAVLAARRTRWRDADGRGLVIAEYEPPAGVDPLLAADLLAKGNKGITAAILDLAVKGAVRIVETKKAKFAVELVNPQLIPSAEHVVVDALFGAGAAVGARRKLGSSDSALAAALYAIIAGAHKRSRAEGYRRSVGLGSRFALGAAAVILAVVSVVLSVVALESGRGGAWPALVMVVSICAMIITLIALSDVRPLTRTGAIAREQLRGLELYIRLAEADRLRVLQSPSGALRDGVPAASGIGTALEQPVTAEQVLRLHEKLLPYSVLFGLEKEWARELASLYEQGGNDPSWYSSTNGFNVALFAAGVSSFASTSSSSWSGSGSSSSSSGASGGGSSGGGGGGGGGGGV